MSTKREKYIKTTIIFIQLKTTQKHIVKIVLTKKYNTFTMAFVYIFNKKTLDFIPLLNNNP